jgi:hypothetical protein
MEGKTVVENILEHYGVKGMRWGFRKEGTGVPSSHRKGTSVSEDKARANESAAKVGRKGNTDALSNHELQSLVTRMGLERQYSSLASQTATKSAGKKFVMDIATNVARKQITAAANDVLSKQIKQALKDTGLK